MSDTTKNGSSVTIAPHRIIGWLLVPLLIFVLLSMLTYNWRDISWLQIPANHPPANLLGLVGAWCTFFGYHLFGLGIWMIPVWMAAAAALLILDRMDELWSRTGWVVACLLALCALLQLASGMLEGTLEELNIDPNAGGAIGNWLMTSTTEQWLSPVGGGLLALTLVVFTGIMAVGPAHISALARGAVQLWRNWREQQAAAAERRGAVRAERADLLSEQEAHKAAERGFTGGGTRPRSLRNAESGARNPEAEAAKTEKEGAATPNPEEERRAELKRRAEEARVATRLAAEQAKSAADSQTTPAAGQSGSRAVAQDRQTVQLATRPAAVVAPETAFANYRLPDISLLDPVPSGEAVHGDTANMAKLLVDTLAQFNLLVEVTHIEPGPVVTRYELLPAAGIKVEKISGLANTLQMVLKAASLRIQAPVPGKNVVGVEVPNPKARMVTLREILQGGAWATGAGKMEIPLALGKDVGGADMVFDLASAPHLLVAGATGSGKSVCLNAILAGLLMSRRPDELKLLLVDPKRVEFPIYNNLPHLLVPVVIDAKKVAFALRWVIVEMGRRYKMLQAAKVRNIVAFNARDHARQVELPLDGVPGAGGDTALPARLPYIVVVIDEVADLMLTVGQEIELSITRLAQLSRAVGIHMILATQRPSVNVITGTIKANFPGRIAFQVAQKTDSRTILDQQGAESLIGRGDMLFLNPKNGRLIRAQGALVNDGEIARVTDFIRGQGGPAFDPSLSNKLEKVQESSPDEDDAGGGGAPTSGEGDDSADEELIQQSIQVIRDTRRASTSSLQRRLRIGYTRAARVMDILEERGMVGPPRGADPREILIDLDAEMPNNDASGSTPDAKVD